MDSAGIPFTKMHGSGNDFVVLDQFADQLVIDDVREFARKVCRRGMSIGADGVIVLSPSATADFDWRYINADGSDGDMCGNGAMVGARYAVDHGLAPAQCSFETPAGRVLATVDRERVLLAMMDATWRNGNLVFSAMPGVTWDRLMIGVPHVVGVVANADDIANLDEVGRAIRLDAQVQPEGANVNVIHRIDKHTIRMRTYERGVEAETLACGTGAVCSAISAVRRGLVAQPVAVRVSSGMTLGVTWNEDGDTFTGITLEGVARVVAAGHIFPDAGI